MRRNAHRRRGPQRTNASLLLGLAVLALGACADLFGLDDAGLRAAAGRAGRGARGGTAGLGGGTAGVGGRAGGTAGASAATGGSSGEPGGEGGSSAGSDGVSAGKAGRGGGGSGGDSGDGAGGEEPAKVPGTERLGDACAEKNDQACSDANPFLLLTCTNGIWTTAAPNICTLDKRCDPRNPGCTPLEKICGALEALGPVCDGNDVVDCSPEHYAAEHRVCPFGCRDGACDPGSATQLTLHTGVMAPTLIAWAGQVPVCVATKNAGAELAWVRDEVEHLFNRFLSVEFFGWEPCGAETSGVVVSFEDDCRGFLVNDFAPGKPDEDAPLAVTICRSYVDNAGDGHAVNENESLIRLLARHQFAHVVGLMDGTEARRTGLLRGVELGSEDDLTLTARNYGDLDTVIGKGINRIATPTGACLTASSTDPGATVTTGPCVRDSDPQVWAPLTDRIRSPVSSSCFQSSATSGDGITLAGCKLTGDAQLFRLAHAQWRTPTRCVAPETIPPVEGTHLLTEPCDAGKPSQAWSFEALDYDSEQQSYQMQIHLADSGLCVAKSANAEVSDPVALAPCAVAPPQSDPRVVQIDGFGISATLTDGFNYCLNSQEFGGLLFLAPCGWNSHYFASGALEAANGMALSLSESGTLVTSELGSAPLPQQLFDVYF